MKYLSVLFVLAFVLAPVFAPVAVNAAEEIPIYGHKDGKSSVVSNSVPVKPQTWYTFSDQYKSGVISEIDLYYTLSDGSIYGIRFEQFPEGKRWQTARIDFATPPGAVSLVIIHSIRQPGHLLAKNFTLLEGVR